MLSNKARLYFFLAGFFFVGVMPTGLAWQQTAWEATIAQAILIFVLLALFNLFYVIFKHLWLILTGKAINASSTDKPWSKNLRYDFFTSLGVVVGVGFFFVFRAH
jgi:divalent metal cation (Fe/Co/Zn/Cd) transporter